MGFHLTWNKWIVEYISSISYSIIINDVPNGLFTPTRGLYKQLLCSIIIILKEDCLVYKVLCP